MAEIPKSVFMYKVVKVFPSKIKCTFSLGNWDKELNFLNVFYAIIFSDKINIKMMKMKRTANLK